MKPKTRIKKFSHYRHQISKMKTEPLATQHIHLSHFKDPSEVKGLSVFVWILGGGVIMLLIVVVALVYFVR